MSSDLADRPAPRPSETGSAASGTAAATPVALVRQALALRAKYRLTTKRVAPELIGVHPENRSGEFPSAERCAELTQEILQHGFDVSASSESRRYD